MAAGGADGSITIDTGIDLSGFNKGSAKLKSALGGLVSTVNGLGTQGNSAFQSMASSLEGVAQQAQISKNDLLSGAGASKAFASLEAQIASIASAYKTMGQRADKGFGNEQQLDAFTAQLNRMKDALSVVSQEAGALGDAKVSTEEQEYLAELIDNLKNKMEQLQARQETLSDRGVKKSSASWRNLQADIESTQNALDDARSRSDALRAAGENVTTGKEASPEDYEAIAASMQVLLRVQQQFEEAAARAREQLKQEAEEAQRAAEQREAEKQAAIQQKEAERQAAAQQRAAERQAREAQKEAEKQAREEEKQAAQEAKEAAKQAAEEAKEAEREEAEAAKEAAARQEELKAKMQSLLGIAKKVGGGMLGAGKSLIKTLAGISLGSHKAGGSAQDLVKALTSLKTVAIGKLKSSFINMLMKDFDAAKGALAKHSKEFNASMSSMMNAAKGVSGNLASVFGNIVNLVAPAITTLIGWISQAVTWLNAFFSLLSGKSTMSVAKKGTDDYAKSLKGAGGAAKELNEQVFSFDELNKEKDDSSGGGGSGAGKVAFEDVSIASVVPERLLSYMQEIKDAVSAGEWEEVGALVADGLNIVIHKVDEAILGITEKATMWAQNLAQIANGFVDAFDFDGLGRTIGDGINLVTSVLDAALTEFDFKRLGVQLANGFNGLVDAVDFGRLGAVFGQRWGALIHTIQGFVHQVDWSGVGKNIALGIRGWFNAIPWLDLADAFATGINGLSLALNTAVLNTNWSAAGETLAASINAWGMLVDWGLLGQTINNGVLALFEFINSFVSNISWKDIGAHLVQILDGFDIVAWSGQAASLLSQLIIGFYETVTGFIEETDWWQLGQDIWDAIQEAIDNIDYKAIAHSMFEYLGAAIGGLVTLGYSLASKLWEVISAAWEGTKEYFSSYFDQYGGNIIDGLFFGILDAVAGIGQWIIDNVVTPFLEGFKSAFGISSPSTVMAEMGKYLIEGLLEGLKNTFGIVTQWLGEALDGIKQACEEAWDDIKKKAKKKWEDIKTTVSGKFEETKKAAGEVAGNLATAVSETWETVKQDAGDAWESIKQGATTGWEAAKQAASTAWSGLTSLISGTTGLTEQDLSNAWESIKQGATTGWEAAKQAAGTAWSGLTSLISGTTGLTEQDLSNAWESIKQGASTGWEAIKNAASTAWAGVTSAVDTTTSSLKSNLSSAWESIKQTASTAWGAVTRTISDAISSLSGKSVSIPVNVKTSTSSIGEQTGQGLINGVKNMAGAAVSAAKNLAGSLASGFKSALGIASPSKVFAQYGEYLVQGLALGVDDNQAKALRSVRDTADAVIGELSGTAEMGLSTAAVEGSLTRVALELSSIANLFVGIADTLQSMGGLNPPALAAGTVIPYRSRIGDYDAYGNAPGDNTRNAQLESQTDILRQIQQLIERMDLTVDGNSLTRQITTIRSSRERAFGGA